MELINEEKCCKYCSNNIELCTDEGLECLKCKSYVHVKCLKRGSVPGGLCGDIFFTFICQECSADNTESFTRIRLSWLQIIVLVLYHLQNKSPGLARRGFFHWRHHVATFIDKNWDILFLGDFKKKKKWTGTIAGTLSHFNKYIFLSGISVFNEPAFWTLMYPNLSPLTISTIYSLMTAEKQNIKNRKETSISDVDLFSKLLHNCIKKPELLEAFNTIQVKQEFKLDDNSQAMEIEETLKESRIKQFNKRKFLKSNGNYTRKLMKFATSSLLSLDELTNFNTDSSTNFEQSVADEHKMEETNRKEMKLLDPLCHYNTSLTIKNLFRMKGLSLQAKLTGGIRQELILSPYSGIYLKPYIRRDTETFPSWLKLMAEIQLAANSSDNNYKLPPRASIDYTYIQPEHIPAINSLCNQFFWPGIDLTETLQYPDFSCVVLYKRLIIGFAFLVPNVSHTENYLSFVFTRPSWRNCGIAKFMIYHLIQTSLGKDITLHVSMNNPVLLLYQKFGFKVENVVLGFYDKYLRSDVNESKHAFFCRLDRS